MTGARRVCGVPDSHEAKITEDAFVRRRVKWLLLDYKEEVMTPLPGKCRRCATQLRPGTSRGAHAGLKPTLTALRRKASLQPPGLGESHHRSSSTYPRGEESDSGGIVDGECGPSRCLGIVAGWRISSTIGKTPEQLVLKRERCVDFKEVHVKAGTHTAHYPGPQFPWS
ncbi:hypothetical protein GWK47_021042 [Chionoecetes opilio]|uniref:Uncharacterized protein n=1 Tax=Chionoecetes opilio TaxID=41210 RepID=A0A8J4XPG5_CHIOP|nr:hypothetical protein GWK47_021042 [Chionoecetes opilio]